MALRPSFYYSPTLANVKVFETHYAHEPRTNVIDVLPSLEWVCLLSNSGPLRVVLLDGSGGYLEPNTTTTKSALVEGDLEGQPVQACIEAGRKRVMWCGKRSSEDLSTVEIVMTAKAVFGVLRYEASEQMHNVDVHMQLRPSEERIINGDASEDLKNIK